MTDAEFEGLVADLRRVQKDYFRDRTAVVLEAAKRLERALDEELRRRAEARKPKVKTLFDQIDEWDQPPTERQLT